MRTSHWDAATSVRASIVVTWIAVVVALGVACVLPFAPGWITNPAGADWVRRALVPMYLCLAAGLVALVILLRVLAALARDEVFTLANVRRLRGISYCGFAIAVVCAVAAVVVGPWPIALGVAAIAAFLGLIMRVVKNVIDAARLIKEDNDYTI